MHNYQTSKLSKMVFLILILFGLNTANSVAQSLTPANPGDAVITVSQTTTCMPNCPIFDVNLTIVYRGGRIIITPPYPMFFGSELIETGLLVELNKFQTKGYSSRINLTPDNDLTLHANTPLIIDLNQYNLAKGIYQLVLVNNGNQYIRFRFMN